MKDVFDEILKIVELADSDKCQYRLRNVSKDIDNEGKYSDNRVWKLYYGNVKWNRFTLKEENLESFEDCKKLWNETVSVEWGHFNRDVVYNESKFLRSPEYRVLKRIKIFYKEYRPKCFNPKCKNHRCWEFDHYSCHCKRSAYRWKKCPKHNQYNCDCTMYFGCIDCHTMVWGKLCSCRFSPKCIVCKKSSLKGEYYCVECMYGMYCTEKCNPFLQEKENVRTCWCDRGNNACIECKLNKKNLHPVRCCNYTNVHIHRYFHPVKFTPQKYRW